MLLWLRGDNRLLGRWRSDAERTTAEIEARGDIPIKGKATLSPMFGKLELRYGRWRSYSTFEGRTSRGWYRVVARDADSVAIVASSTIGGESMPPMKVHIIQHIHFEGDFYWVTLGSSNVREFFRRVS
jgi:hypothetical protein